MQFFIIKFDCYVKYLLKKYKARVNFISLVHCLLIKNLQYSSKGKLLTLNTACTGLCVNFRLGTRGSINEEKWIVAITLLGLNFFSTSYRTF
jgi:hypothetical protein